MVSCNNKWVHCYDDKTIKVAPWPKGSKDLCTLFYVSTATKSSCRTASSHTAAVGNKVSKVCHSSNELQVSCARFSNIDGVSCYSNSLLHCLLQNHALRDSLQFSSFTPIKQLALDYCTKPTLLTLDVRRAVDDQFSTTRQQDVSEFFIKLADVCSEVDNKTQLNMQWDYRCCSCDYSYSRRQKIVC